jgi:Ca2+-binding EF-hand superfamily protein
MMIRKTMFFAIAALLPVAAFAAGQGQSMGAGGEPQYYRDVDTNGDGYISHEELQAYEQHLNNLSNDWAKADTNGDGRVDISEFSAFEQGQVAKQKEQEKNINRQDLEENNPDP